ncbi:hypothetical protein QJS04_geneDACA009301 [Acorus gramineus]|uniref:Uncharacterized protein n=1 Tax=Acorus gramineus TaxID=55184 RepID=A0AAV9A2F4_ACOGR|nr:hypothetical protein QJS04_geneDACA009301 [Acorus gramineus]
MKLVVANITGMKSEPCGNVMESEALPPAAGAAETMAQMNEDLVTLASRVEDQDDVEDDSISLIQRAPSRCATGEKLS